MIGGIYLLAAIAFFATAFQSHGTEQASGWAGFRNERFGFRLSYPTARFRLQQTTTAGDGHLFVSRDGDARLLIGAFENGGHHSPSSYQAYIAEHSYPGFKIDYSPAGRSWSVLSGKRQGTMFYEKAVFSCGARIINSFALTYPVAERAVYDPIVERIEDSFRAGTSGCD